MPRLSSLAVPALLALLFVAPALAQPADDFTKHVTPEALLALRDEVIGKVEQATGVTLDPKPPVATIASDALEAKLRKEIAPQMAIALPDATEEQRAAQRDAIARQMSLAALGKFGVEGKTLFFAPDNFTRVAKLLGQPRIRTRDWLRVVMIHELVHACQEQRWKALSDLSQATSAELLVVHNALVEGHAQWVTQRILLAEQKGELFDAFEASVIALPDNLDASQRILARVAVAQIEFAYIDGRKFFTAVAAKLPAEGLAERLFVEKRPTTRRQILLPEVYIDPQAAPKKTDLTKVWDVAGKHRPGWQQQRPVLDLATLRGAMAPLQQPERATRALAGLVHGQALVMHPMGGGQSVIVAILEHRDADCAEVFDALNRDLSKHKDKTMKAGMITIKGAEYHELQTKRAVGLYGVKQMAVGGQELEIQLVIGRAGRFTIELVWERSPVDQAKATALVDQIAEALGQ